MDAREIYLAAKRLTGVAVRTPLRPSEALSKLTGADISLKLEIMQHTGSFKFRGASNAVMSLDDAARARGLVAVSTGNHGRGLSAAAKRLGARAVICMSKLVPSNKVDAIRGLGAEVRIIGKSQDEAQVESDRLIAEEGMTEVSPYDDPAVIGGQGTIGLELLQDMPEIETVIVPISGGGLIGGIALALKSALPSIRVIGVCMERGPAMFESIKVGKPVPVEEEASLADSLGGGIGTENHYSLALCSKLVDEIVLLSEEQIAEGIRYLYLQEGLVAEGGGAVGPAALIAGLIKPTGPTAVVISGRNIDMDKHARVLAGGSA
jgi:threonine dehydratase